MLRGVNRFQVFRYRILHKLFQACHRVVAKHIAVIACRVTHVVMGWLAIDERHLLGRVRSTEFKLGDRRREKVVRNQAILSINFYHAHETKLYRIPDFTGLTSWG